jgi:hypothetical protein
MTAGLDAKTQAYRLVSSPRAAGAIGAALWVVATVRRRVGAPLVKYFKFRIASGAALLVLGLLFAVGHGVTGLAILAAALVMIAVVAFKVL